MNTVFSYMYRDASNYKEFEEVVFAGTLTAEEKEALKNLIEDNGDGFIPHQIGLENLQHSMVSFPSEDDHIWHEFDSVEDTDREPTDRRTIQEFINSLVSVEWDEMDACELLGLP